MKAKISAMGYTNVIMVLNMKRFIVAEDQSRFEAMRGLPEFVEVLRKQWPATLHKSSLFTSLREAKKKDGSEDTMSTEQVGFATGVFRSLLLEEYAVPGYVMEQNKVKFPEKLGDNFQFRNLFLRSWNDWKIYIRPTVTGMFLVRLTKKYEKPREIIKIAEDVLNLQESLDVQSARDWLSSKKLEFGIDSEDYKKVKNSVGAFLKWLGSSATDQGELLYNPVQWKIAMEVSAKFAQVVKNISIPNMEPIQLITPPPRLSIPLHDSYVIFHLDELFADKGSIVRSASPSQRTNRPSKDNKTNNQIPVLPADIHNSPLIKRTLLNLIEGAILESKQPKQHGRSQAHTFPVLRWQTIDELMERNLASWLEEICLLTSRTALIIPARKYKRDYLLVSTTPGSTLRVKYVRYWGAIERMIEFAIEVRTLTQLVERESYRSLEEIAKAIQEARNSLHSGDIELNNNVPGLVRDANNVRRLAAMAQGMSDPLVWSRNEYALAKAQYLLDQLGVPMLLTHVDRNISSLNSAVDHVDELYALDLAEKGNDLSVIMTIGLAAASFILTFIMLPSFWTDTQQIETSEKVLSWLFSPLVLNVIGYLGTILGFSLIIFAVLLSYLSAKRMKQIRKILDRSLNRLGR